MSRRSRRICPQCKKKGLFNNQSQKICLRCMHLNQGHKLIPKSEKEKRNKVMWNEQIDWRSKLGVDR